MKSITDPTNKKIKYTSFVLVLYVKPKIPKLVCNLLNLYSGLLITMYLLTYSYKYQLWQASRKCLQCLFGPSLVCLAHINIQKL